MMKEKFTKREERALHKALASVVMTAFPNPERTDCPGTEVLRAIATKRISMRDPAIEHVGQCSPCFAELTKIRQALRRRKVVRATGAGASVIVLAALITYFAFRRVDNQIRSHLGQPGVETGTPEAGGPPSQPGSVPPAPTLQPRNETALLDLRNASVTRSIQPSGSGSKQRPIEIPRGLVELMVYLPFGSEAGPYEVEIRRPNQPAALAAKAQARIDGGITKFSINIDTTSIPAGEYQFAWRQVGSDWSYYPILIR